MKKYAVILLVLGFAFSCFGCAKKEASLEQMQEPVSMEALSNINATASGIPADMQSTAMQPSSAAPLESKLEPLPPSGPYKPTGKEIQEALKNAGYYMGAIDGKVGPKTKKAVEEFQGANGLKADGKVGPKTWAMLGKYLTSAAPETSSRKKSVTLKVR